MGILYLGNQKVTPFVYKNAGNKYGATIDNFIGVTDANGVLSQPSLAYNTDLVLAGVTGISISALCNRFANNNSINSISCPDLTTLGGNSALERCFYQSGIKTASFTKLESVSAAYVLRSCFAYSSIQQATFPLLQSISGNYALQECFSTCSSLTSVSFPELTTISSSSALSKCFDTDQQLASFNIFPKLTTISGSYALSSTFRQCQTPTSASFPNLTTITGDYALNYCFQNCRRSLASASFPKLSILTGSGALYGCFQECILLEDIYFNALTTTSFGSNVNQFSSMMQSTGSTVTHTIHFPSNLESTIQGLTGYPLFGGTSGYVVLSFDLPATE